jgi:hypothetical protein
MFSKAVTGVVSLAAPIIAAAVVDRLLERLPDIIDGLADRIVADLTAAPGVALNNLPDLAERIAKDVLRNLPFSFGSR